MINKIYSYMPHIRLNQRLINPGNLPTLFIMLTLTLPAVGFALDSDSDGVDDTQDNCIEIANPLQRDSNGDGFGNVCDADLDNNGSVSFADLDLFKSAFGSNDADADFDGNGFVSFADLDIFKTLFGKPPGPAYTKIIFETDFSNDIGYKATRVTNIDSDNVPTGWDGVKASGNSALEVLAGMGKGSEKPALKLSWDPELGQPTVSLLKHLTGDKNTGFDELYVRYQVKLPNNFKAGDGSGSLPYWKWGRLWQNTSLNMSNWTENRVDSFYVVSGQSGLKLVEIII